MLVASHHPPHMHAYCLHAMQPNRLDCHTNWAFSQHDVPVKHGPMGVSCVFDGSKMPDRPGLPVEIKSPVVEMMHEACSTTNCAGVGRGVRLHTRPCLHAFSRMAPHTPVGEPACLKLSQHTSTIPPKASHMQVHICARVERRATPAGDCTHSASTPRQCFLGDTATQARAVSHQQQ